MSKLLSGKSLYLWTLKGLVINYGEGIGLQHGKSAGLKLVAPPPPSPSRQGQTFLPPPPLLKDGNFACHPISVLLKLQTTA